jgi:hypothetical protein
MTEFTHPDPEILSAHLDGELPPSEESSVNKHLASCPACREALRRFHDVKAALARTTRPEMPAALARAVEKRLGRNSEALDPDPLPARNGDRSWMPWAALAFATMIVGFWLRGFLSVPGHTVQGVIAQRGGPSVLHGSGAPSSVQAKSPPDLLCRSIEWGPNGGKDLPISCPPGYLKESTAKSDEPPAFPAIYLKSVSPTPRASNEAQAKKP